MQSEELRDRVSEVTDEMKGDNTVCLDLTDKSSVTDFMIVTSGTSNRHVKSIADRVIETCKQDGIHIVGVEGRDNPEWVLVDLGDVVLHVMLPAVRAFYDLERLWDHTQEQQSRHPG